MVITKKKQLTIILSKLAANPDPKLKWEGYALDSESAAEMIFIASQVNDDIRKRTIIDLGCGSGTLAIAASLLDAKWVVGVDINKEAINTARKNVMQSEASVDLIAGDISSITGHFDTTLMNPPFGSRRKGADVHFLTKALEISDVIYSFHKRSASARDFLARKIPTLKGRIDQIHEMKIVISRTYRFHRKKKYVVEVDLYRIQRL